MAAGRGLARLNSDGVAPADRVEGMDEEVDHLGEGPDVNGRFAGYGVVVGNGRVHAVMVNKTYAGSNSK